MSKRILRVGFSQQSNEGTESGIILLEIIEGDVDRTIRQFVHYIGVNMITAWPIGEITNDPAIEAKQSLDRIASVFDGEFRKLSESIDALTKGGDAE